MSGIDGYELFSDGEPPQDGAETLSCEQALRQLERLIADKDLKEVERSLLRAHLRVCPACRTQLESYRRIETRLTGVFAALDTPQDFHQRVMDRLPRAGSADAPEWLRQRVSENSSLIRLRKSHPRRRLSRVILVGVPIALALLLLAGVIALYQYIQLRESDAAPQVASISNKDGVFRIRADGESSRLEPLDELQRGDAIRTGGNVVKIALGASRRFIGNVTFAPNSRLSVTNRHTFHLVAGAACFQINKDRPKRSENEYFEVAAGNIATVRVTGTTFVIDLRGGNRSGITNGTDRALVAVEEGSVEVGQPFAGKSMRVGAGKEALVNASGIALQNSDIRSRVASVTGVVIAVAPQAPAFAARPAPDERAPLAPKPPDTHTRSSPQPVAPFKWETIVKGPLPLSGRTLAEGLATLSDAIDRPAELKDMLDQVPEPFADGRTLSFSVQGEMPVASVLAWMARDLHVGFEPARDGRAPTFASAAPALIDSAAGSGIPPEDIRRALGAKIEDSFPTSGELTELVERLGNRAGVTMILDRGPWCEQFKALEKSGGPALPGETVLKKLDALLATLRLGCAWYDGALYISAPAKIERLTLIDRQVLPGAQLIGQPLNPAWAGALKDVLATLCYPDPSAALSATHLPLSGLHSDAELAGKPVFAYVAPADADGLRFRSGLLGSAALKAALQRLSNGSAAISSPAALLTQAVSPGVVRDVDTLVAQARTILPVESRARFAAFNNQAVVMKSVSLGEALEWTTWLAGRGLRVDQNVLVLDEAAVCYGGTDLQVVPLGTLVERQPNAVQNWPAYVARLLPELYPAFFEDTKFSAVANRLVFYGDRRQLELAQHLRDNLDRALVSGAFKNESWRPPWRVALESNLAEKFRGGETLSGTFASILRTSPLSSQLRCSVLVDPAKMKEHAADPIADLPAANATIRELLGALAAKAGMKVHLEGGIIWLR